MSVPCLLSRCVGARAFVALAALVLFGAAGEAGAEVVKCVGANGEVTYQESPCGPGSKGGALPLRTDNGATATPSTTADWSAAALDRRIVQGMPKAWVTRVLGPPAEVRLPRAGEQGAELWAWTTGEERIRVGFAGDLVVWQAREPIRAVRTNESEAARRNVARRDAALKAGRDCQETLAELGPPDREEPANADPRTSPSLPATVRYVYEPGGGDPETRTAFTCIEGKVVDIERSILRR
jgi:hypothetical protein